MGGGGECYVRLSGYELKERLESLDDGITVTKIVKVRDGTVVGPEGKLEFVASRIYGLHIEIS
jgi:hypothetical protein